MLGTFELAVIMGAELEFGVKTVFLNTVEPLVIVLFRQSTELDVSSIRSAAL
jgi:prolyl-tRNA editing enzyme YbaK/EbsC (Cys-tRNA(Pro) deacylase)